MKLCLNGSPNKKSKTLEYTTSLYKIDRLYNLKEYNISHCLDCKYCNKEDSCSIKDDMFKIYEDLSKCTTLILSSPIHFGLFSSELITCISRFQRYFSKTILRKEDKLNIKELCIVVSAGNKFADIDSLINAFVKAFKPLFNNVKISVHKLLNTD